MSEQPKKKPQEVIESLAELRRHLDDSDEVIIGPDGTVHTPDSPEIANTPPQKRTALKPQRWFQR